tara:strand:+ start:3728 stop:4267 length:540 start_codon:yes stop_codon:yes gene_type:complete
MTTKYILTGGPGSGKSTIRLKLESWGEYTIPEAAEDCIKLRQAEGIDEPWKEADFQERILRTQIQRESQIPSHIKRAFPDRGIPDGLVYVPDGSAIYNKIAGSIPDDYATEVFLIETMSWIDRNKVRRENLDQSLRIAEQLEEEYTRRGHRVYRIGMGTPDERTIKLRNIVHEVEGGRK